MSNEEFRKHLEVLELSPDATLAEVKNAYQQLKEIYSSNSIAISSIEDEFPESSRQKVLEQLEEVYKKLLVFFDSPEKAELQEQHPANPDMDRLRKFIQTVTSYSGHSLREIREIRGIQLQEVSLATKIRKGYLQDIELENFDNLPSEIYLKGYVTNYAQFFALDARKVADDYMNRFREWLSTSKKEF